VTPESRVLPESVVVSFNHVNGSDYLADPHAAWDHLRGVGPVVRSDQLGGYWIVTDPDLARETLADVELFSNRQLTIPAIAGGLPLVPAELDPPEHPKYRRLVVPPFTPRAVGRRRDGIQRIVTDLLDAIEPGTEIDFCSAFAHPLPALVFVRLCALPDEDSVQFQHWVDVLNHAETPRQREDAALQLRAFLRAEIARRRGTDAADLLATIANAHVDGRPIDLQMAESIAFNLTLGGLDTTTGLLSLIWRYLAGHAEVRHALVQDEQSITAGLEELLRVFGNANPVRYVTRDVSWHGVDMREGDLVLVGLTPSNRSFGTSPRIGGSEAPCPHIAFGVGHHRCIGLHLARQEVAIAIGLWHERFPDYYLAADQVCFSGGGVFAIKELRLRLLERTL
jgi:cytochrome P450